MTGPRIRALSETEAVQRIVETVQQSTPGAAPFALVLGSGFSHGLVPTARELVNESLPLGMRGLMGDGTFNVLRTKPADNLGTAARDFWAAFVKRNEGAGLTLPLDPNTGLPKDVSAAYRAAFDPDYSGAVGEPALARKFQRALMQLDRPRLNAAHFLLASLLGAQPGKTRESKLFKPRSAFCRLILTTNFDPFLQTALQAVNRLYFMSDTPELGVSDEILDDDTDAIHLVYLHGSIHRRSQAATDDQIKALKEKNARALAPVLKRRGVIVLGYSGWDDALVEAIATCDSFDHRLYWCGREADPLTPGAYGPRVAEILRKPAAAYVPIRGAGHFMVQLYTQLVQGLPRLLENPIGQLREMLQTIDLAELETIAASVPPGSTGLQLSPSADAFVPAQKMAIERLLQAEQAFLSPVQDKPPGKVEGSELSVPAAVSSAVSHDLSSARVAAALGDYPGSIRSFTQALDLGSLDPKEQAAALVERGNAFYFSGAMDSAMADWTRVIEHLPGAPVEQLAKALYNRGVTWGQKGETEKALADYTQLIEQLPGAHVEQVAKALYNRGVTWGQKGETEKALADYTRVIEQLPGAHVEQVAKALNNRGVTWGQKGETDKEIADYTRVIEQLPGAPVEQVAKALVNRGARWGKQGENEKALADYTRVIEQLPGAPVEQVAQAILNRGVTWGQKGDTERELTDYTRVIEQLPGAPVEQVAKALVNRGVRWGKQGENEKALADYTRVIEQLPGAPVEQVAQALVNRGIAWGQKGETEKELADYTRVIEQLPGVPVEQVAKALYYRGITWGQKGETEKALADYTRVIEQLPGAPVEQVAKALINRGVIWGKKGEAEKELADYTRVIEQLPGAPAEQVAQAQANRGWWQYTRDAFDAFLSDTEAALSKQPDLDSASFNLGLALMACGRDADALAAYRRAAERFPDAIEKLGMPDLSDAQTKWLSKDRAVPVIDLLKSIQLSAGQSAATTA